MSLNISASFGFAVMGRISLLIGRFDELIEYSSVDYNYATPIIFIIMVITLGFWSYRDKKKVLDNN